MARMGFVINWIETIMKCLTSVSYSIVVNGYIGEKFQPTRGLCQGDPLSSFLFLICEEGLSCLMRLAAREALLKGVKANRNGPQWKHLMTIFKCGKENHLENFQLWFIWSSRNKLIHEKKSETGTELSQKAQRYMAELEGLTERMSTLNTDRSHSQREANTRVTIQFNAAFDKRDFKSALSLVVWAQSGELLETKTVLNTNVPSPFAAKAYVGLQALKLGISMDLLPITIMGDSHTVIKKCQSMKPDKSVIEVIISDIQSKKICFQEISFQFINRTKNVYAHKIAAESLKKGEETHLKRVISNLYHSNSEGRWRRNPN
ncbi:hypothetical protein PVK06_043016 [Gossypium arboreum]|uniref:RNase H type-1 domain-containing protein n=1 Tax=Gossypium arboreum TaxID=29729 RepID=A0ABR0MMR7_GOSAR|nr:hypothetical protein PVK06_043016 [Gossypium arboreum]